ncbi:hypothetical protein ACTXT7_009844 [Hymenolepis weldensis]
MDSGKTILVSVLFANAIKQAYFYFVGEETVEIKPPPPPVEIRNNWEEVKFSSGKLNEPSWFLPIALATQLSIIFTFLQNLSKRELPRGRIRYYLIGLIVTDLLLMPKKMKSFSGLALLISLITGSLTPLTFEKPPALRHHSNFMEYRNVAIDINYIQRLHCFHLCPCLALAVILVQSRIQKDWSLLEKPKVPDEKGDSESCVLKMGKFVFQSMVLHYFVSVTYALLTLGIKAENEKLIELINQFDTSDNVVRKFGYLQQMTNIVCLSVCMNMDSGTGNGDNTLNFSSDESNLSDIDEQMG